jgi:DNA modification methylase
MPLTLGSDTLFENQHARSAVQEIEPNGSKNLGALDWNFTEEDTEYLTHTFHPYPAKFIPQIPRRLIEQLSQVGDVILDPFTGSGTTLVEAILLDRDAVGVDANPLAALISKVKATPLASDRFNSVAAILEKMQEDVDGLYGRTLFHHAEETSAYPIPHHPKLDFWFKPHVIQEGAVIKHHIEAVKTYDPDLYDFLRVAFSSILVAVSNQDSDTRYTRREKRIGEGDTLKQFYRRVKDMIERMGQFAQVASYRRPRVFASEAQQIDSLLEEDSVDLVVSSPPYPNAYSYHLYHFFRMVWLDMDPYDFKRKEIGSHRKYSAKNGATAETFFAEMSDCYSGIRKALRPKGLCCMVIGDSIVRGKLIDNSKLLIDVAGHTGFSLEDRIERTIAATKKAFNPDIGRIKTEHILIFRSTK